MLSHLSLPLLLAILSGLAFSLLGVSYKMADKLRCRPAPFSVVFMFVAGGLCAIGAAITPTAWTDWRLWALGVGTGVPLLGTLMALLRANALGPASISWTVVNLSLLVPILLSPVLLGERPLWVDAPVVLLFGLSLLAFSRGMTRAGEARGVRPLPYGALLLTIFLMNGAFLLGQKLKYAAFPHSSSAGYAAIFYLTCGLLAAAFYRRGAGQPFVSAAERKAGLCAGLSSAGGMLLILAAMRLPAVVVYPVSQGIALLGGVVLAAVLYRERWNGFKSLGLALGMAVLILAVCREDVARLVALAAGR